MMSRHAARHVTPFDTAFQRSFPFAPTFIIADASFAAEFKYAHIAQQTSSAGETARVFLQMPRQFFTPLLTRFRQSGSISLFHADTFEYIRSIIVNVLRAVFRYSLFAQHMLSISI